MITLIGKSAQNTSGQNLKDLEKYHIYLKPNEKNTIQCKCNVFAIILIARTNFFKYIVQHLHKYWELEKSYLGIANLEYFKFLYNIRLDMPCFAKLLVSKHNPKSKHCVYKRIHFD